MIALHPAPLARAAGAVSLTGALLWSCTVFNGLTATQPGEGGGGAGGAGPAGPSYLDLDAAVRACGHVLACPGLATSIAISIGVPADAESLSRCVSWLSGPIPEGRAGFDVQAQMLACVAAAPDCAGALGCAFVEVLQPGDARCAGVTADVCSGEELLDCGRGVIERCDSVRYSPGTSCRLGLDGIGQCSLAGCLPATHGPPACEGNTLILCDVTSRLRLAVSCTSLGLTCGEDATGQSAICGVNGAILPCDTAGEVTCSPDGTTVRVCTGQVASEIDCAALGAACVAEGASARCAWPADECAPADADVDTCEGSVISLCVAGRRTAFDCASVGLACQPGSGAQRGSCG